MACQVAGETEVKAQIKLRVRTAQGAPVVIVRSFQLVQKAKALQVRAPPGYCISAHQRCSGCGGTTALHAITTQPLPSEAQGNHSVRLCLGCMFFITPQ